MSEQLRIVLDTNVLISTASGAKAKTFSYPARGSSGH